MDDRPPAGKCGNDSKPFLHPAHLADLRASGLSDPTIRDARLYTVVSPQRVSRLLGWRRPATTLGVCLAFPFRAADGTVSDYVRLKPSKPRVARNGKAIKYESPIGRPNRVYFPPAVWRLLNDPSVPLLITEGEKKSLKATQEGFPCLGLVGVWGWCRPRPRDASGRGTGPFYLIDDLAAVAWKGREVAIVYDSDAATNPNVLWAERLLAAALRWHGAAVAVVRLPGGVNGSKVGLDDYLLAHGPDALRRLVPAWPRGGVRVYRDRRGRLVAVTGGINL
jgi:putative DNA primase/helicase